MNVIRSYPIFVAVVAFVLGVLIGRSNLFGYSSAEECAIRAQTRIGAASCYRLYEPVKR